MAYTSNLVTNPHFQTFAGSRFDYHGECDLKLVEVGDFQGGLGLTINIRTKIRATFSYIESAVLQIGNEALEVSSFGDYILSGVSHAELPGTISGFPITHSQPSNNVHIFEIAVGDEDTEETIVLKSFKDMMSVKIDGATEATFRESKGMMGAFDKDGGAEMLARDGVTILDGNPHAFAVE